MGRAAVFILAFAGAGVGALTWLAQDPDRAVTDKLSSLVQIAAEGSRGVPAPVEVAPSAQKREFAPRQPLIAEKLSHGAGSGEGRPVIVAQATIVSQMDAPNCPSAAGPDTATKRSLGYMSAKPSDGEGRRELARSIHQELKRVGCFEGDVDGAWTSKSRQGMKAFTERINATLPIEEPDYILLTLLQGHAGKACGQRCPSGQVAAGEGQCQPRAVVAQTDKQTQKRPIKRAEEASRDAGSAPRLATAGTASSAPPLPGRMAIGAPAASQLANERKEADAVAEAALRRQQVLIEQRKVRIEAERQAQVRAAEEARAKAQAAQEESRRKSAALEQARAEQARHEAEQRVRAEAERQARRDAERQRADLAQAEAERVRQGKLEAERLARAQREEERRIRVAAAQEARRQEAAKAADVQSAEQAAASQTTSSTAVAPALQGAQAATMVVASPVIAPNPAAGAAPTQAATSAPGPAIEPQKSADAEAPPKKAKTMTSKRKNRPADEGARDRSPPPRFVQRFVPPPTFYVGRTSAPSRAANYGGGGASPSFRSTIFTGLSRSAP